MICFPRNGFNFINGDGGNSNGQALKEVAYHRKDQQIFVLFDEPPGFIRKLKLTRGVIHLFLALLICIFLKPNLHSCSIHNSGFYGDAIHYP